MKTKKQILKFIFSIVIIALAGAVGGISFNCFFASMDPQIVPTGMSGFAMLVSTWLSFAGVNISVSIIYLILNVILFTISLKFFGWKFLVFSGVGLGSYVLGMEFGNISLITESINDPLLYCIVGSLISGLTVGIAMRMGGSTGGSDVFGALTNRIFPKIKTGYAILAFNVVVLILSVITRGLDTGLYALINSILSSIATDMVLDRSKKIVAFNIICDKPDEISQAIMQHYGRGVTRLEGKGMFTQNNKALLLCLVPYDQSYKMREFVTKIDEGAFVYSTPVTETIGEGLLGKLPNETDSSFSNKKARKKTPALPMQEEVQAEKSQLENEIVVRDDLEKLAPAQSEGEIVKEKVEKGEGENKKSTKKASNKKASSTKSSTKKTSANKRTTTTKNGGTKPPSKSSSVKKQTTKTNKTTKNEEN